VGIVLLARMGLAPKAGLIAAPVRKVRARVELAPMHILPRLSKARETAVHVLRGPAQTVAMVDVPISTQPAVSRVALVKGRGNRSTLAPVETIVRIADLGKTVDPANGSTVPRGNLARASRLLWKASWTSLAAKLKRSRTTSSLPSR
jgi:hypothetical protein